MNNQAVKIHQKEIALGRLRFHCLVAGDEQDSLVVLLHGFPETSHMWRPLMKDLVSAGYYCLAPNMRGYSENACPKGKKNYRIELLVRDVLDLAAAVGKSKFHLIAHDWGAVIGWYLAYDHPEILVSYTSLSVPHLKGFYKAIGKDKDQQYRSRYIKKLLVPFIAEYAIRKNDFEAFRKLWKFSSKEELKNYLEVFRKRKILTAALNYYRANLGKSQRKEIGEIRVPVLFIWGNKDMAIGPYGVSEGHQYCKGGYKFLELNAGHWLIQTMYDDIKQAVLDHLEHLGQ
ncbi:alpha/beta fold hydrolase [Muriicola soli]|uniref:alpha/beta fold hydrolase n=1 Tax=Muriicola soli TaxID=2507538 RepID=UPI0013EA94A8|nr:alpha/beta hydrolase [Muriicola soli]